MKELSIGQMARLNGLSEQTLRLYDKAGLFSPMYRDAENGYRYYDIRQSAQLDMIQHMKALVIIPSFSNGIIRFDKATGGAQRYRPRKGRTELRHEPSRVCHGPCRRI